MKGTNCCLLDANCKKYCESTQNKTPLVWQYKQAGVAARGKFFRNLMVLQREEQGELKPLVLGLNRHGAAVFLGGVAHALQAVAVVLPVGLGGHGQTILKDGRSGTVVFHTG